MYIEVRRRNKGFFATTRVDFLPPEGSTLGGRSHQESLDNQFIWASVRPAMQRNPSPTWILFASGRAVTVELSLFEPPAERSRPMAAYIVSEAGPELARSASRAVEAVYSTAYNSGIAPEPAVVGYDLPGLAPGCRISGASAGLALALALAKKLWPEHDPGPLAATGEIASAGNGGRLAPIAGFAEKARAALELLPEGGGFYFPAANQPELDTELRKIFAQRRIALRPVESVAGALAHFLPAGARQHKNPKRRPAAAPPATAGSRPGGRPGLLLPSLLLLGIGLALGLYCYSLTRTPAPPAPALQTAPPRESAPRTDNNPGKHGPLPAPAQSARKTGPQPSGKTAAGQTNAPPTSPPTQANRAQMTTASPQTVSSNAAGRTTPAPALESSGGTPSREEKESGAARTKNRDLAAGKRKPARPAVESTNKKQPATATPRLPANRKRPAKPAPAVVLKADSHWLERLSQRTRARLAARLDSEPGLKEKLARVEGNLAIVRLSEQSDPGDGHLETTLTLAFRGRIIRPGRREAAAAVSLSALQLSYRGPAALFPDRSVSELAEKITTALKHKLTGAATGTGFSAPQRKPAKGPAQSRSHPPPNRGFE